MKLINTFNRLGYFVKAVTSSTIGKWLLIYDITKVFVILASLIDGFRTNVTMSYWLILFTGWALIDIIEYISFHKTRLGKKIQERLYDGICKYARNYPMP